MENSKIIDEINLLESQRKFLMKHVKWCKLNNKSSHVPVHNKVIDEIKGEIEVLKQSLK